MTQATFEIRESFGQVRAYPTNDAAVNLCALNGTKTLVPGIIGLIERLGFQCVDCSGQPITPATLY